MSTKNINNSKNANRQGKLLGKKHIFLLSIALLLLLFIILISPLFNMSEIQISKLKLHTNEEIELYFNEFKDLEYKYLNDLYGGFSSKVKYEDEKVIMKANIDMKQANIEKMLQDKYIDRDYVVSNKLTTGGIKNIYKSKGAKCGI